MVAQTLGDCWDRSDLDGKSEVLQAGNEAMDLLALAAFVEVMRAEVVIEGSGLQHLVDRSEDRGSDGANRLFWRRDGRVGDGIAPAGSWPSCGRRPRRIGRDVVLSHAAALRMRVERRLPALSSFLGHRPAHEIRCPAVGKRLMDAGNGGQEVDGGAKGLDLSVDLLIDGGDRHVDGVDLLQMHAQQKAVMPGDAAAKRFAELLGRRFDPAMRQLGQLLAIALTGDQGFDHPLSDRAPIEIGHRSNLDLAAELDDAVWRNSEELGCVKHIVGHQAEEPVAPARETGAAWA